MASERARRFGSQLPVAAHYPEAALGTPEDRGVPGTGRTEAKAG